MNPPVDKLRDRRAPLEITPPEFRELGHRLVDRIADFMNAFPDGPVNRTANPEVVRAALGSNPLPPQGTNPASLLEETADLLFQHSLLNGHPRFFGYITSSAAPIGALADLLAASINPNLGGWILSPIACEIEVQTVRWMAEMIGYPEECGGLLVSGGNVANFVGFWVARRAKLPGNVRSRGLDPLGGRRPRVYVSEETHTWIQKATDLSGMGTDAIRWVPTDAQYRMNTEALIEQIEADRAAGDLPFMVVGTGGSVSSGAIDPLPELAAICRKYDLWFHVDGAYGAPAAVLPDAPPDLKGLARADSVAMDPHKWLYAPLEAGSVFVRDAELLRETFSYRPPYYPDDGPGEVPPIMYHEYGPQNSRGFRALKVWLALRQVGREGYVRMIGEDIALAKALYDLAEEHPELEAVTHGLSVTTFRFVPQTASGEKTELDYLNRVNKAIVERLQVEGEAFLSNAVLDDRYLLRACVVNFRTALSDVEALVETIVRVGRELDAVLSSEDRA